MPLTGYVMAFSRHSAAFSHCCRPMNIEPLNEKYSRISCVLIFLVRPDSTVRYSWALRRSEQACFGWRPAVGIYRMCRSRMGAAPEYSWDSRARRLRTRCADVSVDASGSSRRVALAIGETAAPGYTYINNLCHEFEWGWQVPVLDDGQALPQL